MDLPRLGLAGNDEDEEDDDDNSSLCLSLEQGRYGSRATFQLRRPTFSKCNHVIITNNAKRHGQMTLVCAGLGGAYDNVDMLEAVKSGLVELVEEGRDELVRIEAVEPPRVGHVNLSVYQQRILLETDSTAELWKAVLRPGAMYEMQLSKSKGELWAYYNNESRKRPDQVSLSEKLPVRRGDGTIRFTCFDDPLPPKLFVKLAVSPKQCHRSGTPGFKIILELSSDSNQAITIDLSDSPFSRNPCNLSSISDLLFCENTNTGQPVDWPAIYGSGLEASRYTLPDNCEFAEILPDKPWRYEYVLNKDANCCVGSLEDLEPGQTYRARAPKQIDWSFSRWMFGRKEDVLAGSLEEKKQTWERDFDIVRIPRLKVYPEKESVVFSVVE